VSIVRIEAASVLHSHAYPAYFQQCRAAGCSHYRDSDDSAAVFYQRVLDRAAGRQLPPGELPTQTWFALDAQGGILGAIRLRHGCTQFILDHCGHIGYEVHPAARGRGVAGSLLAYVQRHGAPQLDGGWLITCDDDNAASQRVISRAGGVLLTATAQGPGEAWLRYYHLPSRRY
jgi:predicted acetyltransferase